MATEPLLTAAGTPAVGMSPSSIVVGDFNGDGISDLAVTNACGNSYPCSDVGTMTILLGNGDGTFTATSETPSAGDSPVFVAVGDFNRDGNLDLAALDSTASLGATNGAVTILLGNGDGTFKTVAVSPATDISSPIHRSLGTTTGRDSGYCCWVKQCEYLKFSSAMEMVHLSKLPRILERIYLGMRRGC